MEAEQDSPELTLRSVNRRLAELLHTDLLPLAQGGGKAMADPLWVWGIVGGKNVGKTTLVHALTGVEMVASVGEVDEGTFQPVAHLSSADVVTLRERFAGLGPMEVTYCAGAPDTMRGLALVDLPDFDSLLEHHTDQVRRIATALDGVIWVTTPKKLGDLRAITEIQRVLKARSNFVYVVNKMDWLLAQADGPPHDELVRISEALRTQISECDPAGREQRTFLVTAKYQDTQGMLQAIAQQRDLPDARALSDRNGLLAEAVERILHNFDSLKKTLTTAPTVAVSLANKRANLAYQTRHQAGQLLEHYQPLPILASLERAADPQAVREIVCRTFHPGYCVQLFEGLNASRALFTVWSASLFRARIKHWAVLGIIAWPLALLGTLLEGFRSLLPYPSGRNSGDPFRFEGLSIEERVDAVLARFRAELAFVSKRVTIELPTPALLVQQFREEALTLASEHRSAVIEPLVQKRPTPIGRAVRWAIPLVVLLWFPLAQPVLTAVLSGWSDHTWLNMELAATLVRVLSPGNVLAGLAASLVILAVLVAMVYSRAVRDASVALEQLKTTGPEVAAELLTGSLAGTIRRPIEQAHAELADATDTLESLLQTNRKGKGAKEKVSGRISLG